MYAVERHELWPLNGMNRRALGQPPPASRKAKVQHRLPAEYTYGPEFTPHPTPPTLPPLPPLQAKPKHVLFSLRKRSKKTNDPRKVTSRRLTSRTTHTHIPVYWYDIISNRPRKKNTKRYDLKKYSPAKKKHKIIPPPPTTPPPKNKAQNTFFFLAHVLA